MQGSQQFEYFWTEVPLIGSSILGEAPGSPPGPEKSLQIALVFHSRSLPFVSRRFSDLLHLKAGVSIFTQGALTSPQSLLH